MKNVFLFGGRPPAAKVTGVVEESPGPLEYEVGLYREAKSGRDEDSTDNEVVVEQAVPIGTKLQLRASINTNSGTVVSVLVRSASSLWSEIVDNPYYCTYYIWLMLRVFAATGSSTGGYILFWIRLPTQT